MSAKVFDPQDKFHPLPFLRNPHLQTIAGFLWKGRPFRKPTHHALLDLGDGDQLVLHDSVPPQWHDGDPVALLVHGMGGNSTSGYVQRVSGRLFRHGVRPVRIDMRGTGAGFGLAEGFYHGGRSDDLRLALLEMRTWAPHSPLWLVGFSLGGNLALKLAGEAANDVVPGLERIVAIAPPIDVVRCSDLISQPHNRIYDRFFARKLLSLARVRQSHYPEPPLPEFPRRLSMRDFDDLFTAPRCGFAGVTEYYEQSSSMPLIPKIAVPTLIIAARDDPFVVAASFDELLPSPHIRVEVHAHGGHLGFLGHDGDGGIRWLEARLVRWLMTRAVGEV